MSFHATAAHVVVLTAALVLMATGCARQNPADASKKGGPGSPGQPAAAVIEAVPVEVEKATVGPIASFLSFNSTIEVETSIEVFPEVAGLVEKILVEEGDRVEAGQPLLQLDHDDQIVAQKESQMELEHLESTFRRTEELHTSGLINQQEFETRKYDLAQARLALERATLRVSQATVRAPVGGVVTERTVQPGARVSGGTKLFGLMSLDDMIARVHVPGRYLTSVSEGQEANLSSEFLPGKTFKGWVKRISPIIDATSGTFKVTIGVRGETQPPPPGLFVSVRVVTDRRESAVLVPKRAVIYEGGERFIYVVKEDKAAKVRLDVGYEEGSVVEALSQIDPGAAIVVLGQNALKDKATVRVVNPSGPTAAVAVPGENPAAKPADS